MKPAVVFNLQKFSVHDGPGIRTTVFFKGCPLRCQWCHNPESQDYRPELLYNAEKCTHCGLCVKHCPEKALTLLPAGLTTDGGKCSVCGLCCEVCPNEARQTAGKNYSVAELVREIEKDRPFYEQSGGGVTLSGGEAISQTDFAIELARACHQRGIPVALDTCGHAPLEAFLSILPFITVFLYDIKHMDAAAHKRLTGVDNRLILGNLAALAQKGANINLRLPLIRDMNDTDDHIAQIITFIRPLNIRIVNLLPYHAIAAGKYSQLGLDYEGKNFAPPPENRLQQLLNQFTAAGFTARIGG